MELLRHPRLLDALHTQLIEASDLQHMVPATVSGDVPAFIDAAKTDLRALAQLYGQSQVAGQATNTIDGKRRDLERFLTFFFDLYGHFNPAEGVVKLTAPKRRCPARRLRFSPFSTHTSPSSSQ